MHKTFAGLNEEELIKEIDKAKIPAHVAVIMDGNGRWAKKKKLPRAAGHKAGIKTLKNTVAWSKELGVKVLTLYAFSTENWLRPKEEVDFLMRLPIEYLKKELPNLIRENVKLQIFGEKEKLPITTQKAIEKAMGDTKGNDALILNFAFNYGGRAEIINAVKSLNRDLSEGKIKIEQVNEDSFAKHLFSAGLPDPDLLIRPSGEFRLSNFLLWQLAYAELWFSDVLWPDFKKVHFLKAIFDYQQRDRRFGGIKL